MGEKRWRSCELPSWVEVKQACELLLLFGSLLSFIVDETAAQGRCKVFCVSQRLRERERERRRQSEIEIVFAACFGFESLTNHPSLFSLGFTRFVSFAA